jgi:membrane associated rhomboid family serine protease
MSPFQSVRASDMRFLANAVPPITRCGITACEAGGLIRNCSRAPPFAHWSSSSTRPLRPSTDAVPRRSTGRQKIVPNPPKSQIDSSRKAALLLNRLSKTDGKIPSISKVTAKPVPAPAKTPRLAGGSSLIADASETIDIDGNEEAIQRRIVHNRTKLLWPGIWTFFAIAGTYGGFAYWDARSNRHLASDDVQLPKRTQLPDSWFLTPTVVKDGVKAGWSELDKLTIGIVLAIVGIHLMKKSPLPFWEKLIHITGEKRYTAFTYPFAHVSWGHLSQNVFTLCWFMPGVVQYLDGDLFHTSALFVSVPLLTSYLQHFVFRWGPVSGIPLEMGSSGAIAAMFGAFCVAYPDEKVWLPSFAVVRLDAQYWCALFVLWQLASMVKTPKGGNRPAFMVGASNYK